jgi:hypothetical protein
MPYALRNSTDVKATVPPISQGSNDSSSDNDDTNPSTTTPVTTEQENTPPKSNNSDSDSNSSDDESQNSNHFWNGDPPKQKGTLAKLFTTPENRATTKTHEELVHFLYTKVKENKATKLQFDNDLVPYITAVPGSDRKVRLIYGIGSSIGLTGIHDNDLKDKILALTGEFEENVSFPTVLQFPNKSKIN